MKHECLYYHVVHNCLQGQTVLHHAIRNYESYLYSSMRTQEEIKLSWMGDTHINSSSSWYIATLTNLIGHEKIHTELEEQII